jgi:transcriptional regulator with XRE-family HTH domain
MQNYQRLRDLREDADLTQKQVADLLFMHTTQYRRYECGDSEIPLDVAVKLANYYNVSLDYIAGRTNEKMGLTKSGLTDDETHLIKSYRQMTEKNKGRILERVYILSRMEE